MNNKIISMIFTTQDLEEILKVALERAPQHGFDQDTFESVYRASVAEVAKKKADDVNELYSSLEIDTFYIESFQMKTKGQYILNESEDGKVLGGY